MKRKWKIVIGAVLLLLIGIGSLAAVQYQKRGIVTVQTGKVMRQDLVSVVTASGEVRPRNYINIGANATGPITAIYVKEGDRVKKGHILARIESIQANADMMAQKANLNSILSDSTAGEAGLQSADANVVASEATVEKTKADLVQKKLDGERAEQLFNAKLIARQDYDAKRAAYDGAIAAVREAEGKLAQAKSMRAQTAAQLSSAQLHVTQQQAMLRRYADVYAKYDAIAPLDGVVTNLPVRVGETVVPGIQNSAASTIMTIADMSVITAEVKVDETDIVNVRLGQIAEVSVDAIPDKKFAGKVIEIGDTAIIRSSGLAASQSQTSSQEAKDFKVVVALEIPEDMVRPGLSCTARITTATRPNALSIPLQALTVRQRGDLQPAKPAQQQAAPATQERPSAAALKAMKEEVPGVFVINGEKAEFRKVQTGITGATDIEVTGGIREGDQIVVGSYAVIRTLKTDAKIKIDNKKPPQAGPQTQQS